MDLAVDAAHSEEGGATDTEGGFVCAGRGECVEGHCLCAAGFREPDCMHRTCDNDCSGHVRRRAPRQRAPP